MAPDVAASRAPLTRADLEALDRADELARFRDEFELPAGIVYLDGNSLGPLPRRTRERILSTVDHEWARGLGMARESLQGHVGSEDGVATHKMF